ncbi:MMPL family transporter [Paenibacillus thermotolerans]|uniref:MMPL family transporter n=1 Tax=Paenibacillus thermotolerans TaxID=3027807 RepID=UPI00236794DE|nr:MULTISPECIES: MMPL family transporter [unclassified Paenibacillus]
MMHRLKQITGWASSRRGAKIVFLIWLAVIVILSVAAPAAKKYAVSAGEGSIHENTPSAVAEQVLNRHFPSEEGLPALVVFHKQGGMDEDGRLAVAAFSSWLSSANKPEHVGGSLPFHRLPVTMYSEDRTTLLYRFSLKDGADSAQIYETLEEVRGWLKHNAPGLQTEITGPAGIASDTSALFKNADLVLLFATVGLILALLLLIYRSPLLALMPLLISGFVYQATDRIIGLAGKQGWFIVDRQALSIMMILLFAVLTDYCLFIFSRYKEELKKAGNRYDAMKSAMSHVGEAIVFSGGTVLIAMLTLFTAIFKPYHHFAPVFSVAMTMILLSGLTLIPAVFAMLGRQAFWPFVPKLETGEAAEHRGIWGKAAAFCLRRPAVIAIVLLAAMAIPACSIGNINYSFNLMKSFPEHASSRIGFELLEKHFPKGKLAPVTVILTSDEEIAPDEPFLGKLAHVGERLQKSSGVDSSSFDRVSETGKNNADGFRDFISEDKHAVKFDLTLSDNPYDREAIRTVDSLRKQSDGILVESGLGGGYFSLHFAGQTAEQLDVSKMNSRDTELTFSLITGLILLMLIFQTRSLWMALLMIATILLSYAATLGFGWFIFHNVLGYEAISYRIPVYTFVFLVALGVDYNIMLVSRIREEAEKHEWKDAIRIAVARTGGVISSAGVILAATFAVLITQPIQELFLFGMTMALGILLDTFLVRGVLLPSILALAGTSFKRRL